MAPSSSPVRPFRSNERWVDEYHRARGEDLVQLWDELRRDLPGKVLIVSGRGYDPRMTLGASVLARAGWNAEVTVALLAWGADASHEAPLVALADANVVRMSSLMTGAAVRQESVSTTGDSHIVTASNAHMLATRLLALETFRHVILDVSALPRALYFPILGALLSVADNQPARTRINLHAFVSEDPALDARIHDRELAERAEYLPGFMSNLASEAHAGRSKIWIPILGERQEEHLRRIYTHVAPQEICPVLPSPARHPRRADDLVIEYHALLFDQLRVEPRNILYADEQNPFELYRQLRRTIRNYESALEPIGGCRVALSAHSSKLMSVGVLLTAYEMRHSGHSVGVAHLESTASEVDFDPTHGIDALTVSTELHGLWLAGACYDD